MKIRTYKNQTDVTFERDQSDWAVVGVKWAGKPHQVVFIDFKGDIHAYDEKEDTSTLLGHVPWR